MNAAGNTSPHVDVAYGVASFRSDVVLQLWPDGSIRENLSEVNDDGLRHLLAGWKSSNEVLIRVIIDDPHATTEEMISSAVARIYLAARAAKVESHSVLAYLQSESLANKMGIMENTLQEDSTGVKYKTPKVTAK